jgi:hypothetical protein
MRERERERGRTREDEGEREREKGRTREDEGEREREKGGERVSEYFDRKSRKQFFHFHPLLEKKNCNLSLLPQWQPHTDSRNVTYITNICKLCTSKIDCHFGSLQKVFFWRVNILFILFSTPDDTKYVLS